MPTYTYKCTKCNKEFPKMASIATRDAPKDCDCGGEAKRTPKGVFFFIEPYIMSVIKQRGEYEFRFSSGR